MKRFTSIVLLSLYILSNTGFAFSGHYCAGKLVSVSLFGEKKNSCTKCSSMADKQGCCKDTQTQLFLDEDHIVAKSGQLTLKTPALVNLTINFSFDFIPEYSLENLYANQFYVYKNGPPKTPVYIQTHSLIL